MGTLDQVTQMKNEGRTDQEISGALQQQGISPKEITDALSQAQIKNAVAGESPMPQEMNYPDQAIPSQPQGQYTPSTQEIPEGSMQGMDQFQQGQGGAYPPEQYSQDPYAGGGYDQGYPEQYAPAATDADTMMGIAEQVFSEKTKKMKKQIDEIAELKTLTQTKLDSIAERLKRLESMFDKLQINILEKVSDYGKGFEQTKKEVKMIQDSFGKMVNKIADHAPTHHATSHTTHKTHSKKKGHKK